MKGNWEFRLAKKEKTICFVLKGDINNVDAASAFVEFKRIIKSIDDGFTIVCNVTELGTATFESRLLLETALKLIDNKNPTKIIRIVKSYDEHTIFDEAYRNLNVKYMVEKQLESQICRN